MAKKSDGCRASVVGLRTAGGRCCRRGRTHDKVIGRLRSDGANDLDEWRCEGLALSHGAHRIWEADAQRHRRLTSSRGTERRKGLPAWAGWCVDDQGHSGKESAQALIDNLADGYM